MKKISRYRWVLVAGMALVFCRSGAQGVFAWRARLEDTVRADGFYEILLTPEVVAKCRADLADVRILGPDNRFVSYVLKNSQTGKQEEDEWMSIPGVVFTQKDSSNKHTYIYLRFPEAYEIHWVAFMIRDPQFYKREAQVSAEGTNPGEWSEITRITMLPRTPMIRIPTVKARELRIDIDNADNAPLVIDDAGCFQLAHCLLAYLKAGVAYQVVAGDKQAAAPDYDLRYFTDSVKTTPKTLTLGAIERTGLVNTDRAPVGDTALAAATAKKDTHKPERAQGLLLWSILLAVLVLLVYFSFRMVKAITQKERNDRV